jgi:Flp pilus assembly protein CpaB
MKKNMIPLVAIAFVVAILSTAVFYGLFASKLRSSGPEAPAQPIVVAARNLDRGTVLQAADLRVSELRSETKLESSLAKPDLAVGQTLIDPVQTGEPITRQRLGSTAAGGVPKGMRGVSIRVADSAGIASLLRPGAKVDVQAFSGRSGSVELKTILQNVEVLSVNPQTEAREGAAATVVTVLTRPQDTDLIALADSGARIRVAMRNPTDNDTVPGRSLAIAALFQSGRDSAPTPALKNVRVSAPAAAEGNPVQLSVHVLGANADAVREIDSKLAEPAADSVRIASFRAGIDTGELIQKLVEKRELEILSSSRLTVGARQPATMHAGANNGQLRVQFSSETDSRGKIILHVKPDVSWKRAEGVETRGFESAVPNANSFVLSGLLKSQPDRRLLEAIFPGHSWNGRELVILVSVQRPKLVHTAALTRTHRGR